ncbi:nitroreductase family protein [Acidihalobacter ferrooxydans]|uniref:Nitroreductase n=1 Tax=Acidihalobacter ferrooxydans TaxID=1765967 RepID=A0A1P8UGB7_9GAMM|nr:nitroreductase family protein [Acidihalobacter ferrooxydans]APZ42898.1 nitroreductase [Acidihalobacter ferrooxydans]
MTDFFATIRRRHSVRRYQADMAVETEKLHAILESAIAAPSAGDLQAYQIVVVRAAETRRKLADVTDHAFLAEAPVCLVFCTDAERSAQTFGERGRELFALQDTTIAAAYAQLAAVAGGLGSAWVGGFVTPDVAATLGLEAHLAPVAMLALGYAAELPEPTTRRRLDEIVVEHDA